MILDNEPTIKPTVIKSFIAKGVNDATIWRTIKSTDQKKTKISSQSHTGIALGRGNYTNRMMFWDPSTSRFSVSAHYTLDPDCILLDLFPELSVPWYTILPIGSNNTVNVSPFDLLSPDDPMLPCDRHLTKSWTVPQLPNWITSNARITIYIHGHRRRGNLLLDAECQWTFVQLDDTGTAVLTINRADLPTTWVERLLDNSLEFGWQEIPRAFHVSACGILRGVPPYFKQSMMKKYTDYQIWLDFVC
jgi:hypothetical protein